MQIHKSLVLLAAVLVSPSAIAQSEDHSQHQRGAVLTADQMGSASVQFNNSCAPDLSEDINKGVALLHSFWFPETIRVFESALKTDRAAMRNPIMGHRHGPVGQSVWRPSIGRDDPAR